VLSRFDDVVGFAELEAFIDDPIRTYSSGMVARLAFSIATHIDGDVLLIDEVLAVGDIAFQERCIARLRTFQEAGVTMLIVSHEPQILSNFCDEVIWLVGGSIVASGRPDEVTKRYRAAMEQKARAATPGDTPEAFTPTGQPLRVNENRFGSQEAQLMSVELLDHLSHPVSEVRTGDALTLRFEVRLSPNVRKANLGVHLVRDDGTLCFDTSGPVRARGEQSERHALRLEIGRLDLAPGSYEFEVGLYSADWALPYDYHALAYPLSVTGESGGGILSPPVVWCDEPTRDGFES
jgi:lipopolysaccharide transport system ATP-binding protein